MNAHRIELTTKKQIESAKWLVEAYDGLDLEELNLTREVVPRIEGKVLVLANDKDLIEDVLYRLEDQMAGMVRLIPEKGSLRSSNALADKIRAVVR